MNHHDIIVIGGGAAGITCSIRCKDLGMDVAILEGSDRICKKVLTTGNGRCNISNSSVSEPFDTYHSDNNHFFDNVLRKFSVSDTVNFFTTLGLPITTIENGKMYPLSLQASSVIDIFRMALSDRDIPCHTGFKVSGIRKSGNTFIITSKSSDEVFSCNSLVLACGGKSASNTGSDGSGYTLAKSFGHKIVSPLPGIVQLKLDYKNLKALSGVKFNGWATLYIDGAEARKEFGEILFTDYGISGPPILQISSMASKAISKGYKASLSVDMMPEYSKEELINFLEGHFAMFSHRSISESLIGIVNKKIIVTLLKEAGVSSLHKPCYEITWKEKASLYEIIKNWTFDISGTNSFNNAQVTVGGVDTRDVSKNTLESKLCKNLFFCGELLDVDGDCGGFNLQWAWSSALNVAHSIKNNG